MGIRFSRTDETAHKRLSVLIFGEPKVGKTTLAKTLPLTSDDKLLYVAADPGQLALRDRKFVVAQPDKDELTEQFFDDVRDHVRKDGNKYEWIFVDGVDEVADAILKSKLRVQRDGRKAYGEMAEYVESWMKAIRDVRGVSVVFVTHIEQREAGDGEVENIPMFPGKQIQNHVNEWFDLIGCMRLVRNSDNKLERYIQFRREADWRYVVGDRSGVTELYEEPDLGKLFRKIHEAGFQTKGEWRTPTVKLADLQELVELGKQHNKTPQDIKAILESDFGGKQGVELTLVELEKLKSLVAS